MEVETYLLYIILILVAAKLFAATAAKANIPSVLGELFAGVVLGPSLLGWIEPVTALKLMAEIGIILLLFEVGLETELKRLVSTGYQSFVVAILGFALPFAFGFIASFYLFELPLLVSMFVGGTITATSIGITIRILNDLRRRYSHEGHVVLGAAVLDDVLGVILLAMLYEFSVRGGVSFANAGTVFIFVAAFFILAPIAAKLVSLLIESFHSNHDIPGLIPTLVISLVLFFAWLAHALGAPELLGGFAAGLALSRRFFLPFGVAVHTNSKFAKLIEQQMQPIIHLFTPIFFVMIGISLNLRVIDWSSPFIWLFSLSLFVLAIAGKMAAAYLTDNPWQEKVAIGMAMTPRGEVGLIFAELGRESTIFSNDLYAGMVIVIALTTIVPPFTLRWFYKRQHDYFFTQGSLPRRK